MRTEITRPGIGRIASGDPIEPWMQKHALAVFQRAKTAVLTCDFAAFFRLYAPYTQREQPLVIAKQFADLKAAGIEKWGMGGLEGSYTFGLFARIQNAPPNRVAWFEIDWDAKEMQLLMLGEIPKGARSR